MKTVRHGYRVLFIIMDVVIDVNPCGFIVNCTTFNEDFDLIK